ncbi:aconitase family protein [Kitasatospora sp. NPDC018058]|uniref:aconitase family protein n=1 Tax=Kitasatospora sp. NPDC018058 TaxID=3364025 RepID=UPI0037C0B348
MAGYREEDFRRITAEPGCCYDFTDRIELSALEPLVARPSSPGNVVRVREVAGTLIGQVVLGSSAKPGVRDYAVAAAMFHGRQTSAGLSFDVNPSFREVLQDLLRTGTAFDLIAAGARIHQAGCLGCIGMGQAPASGRHSLRTFPRRHATPAHPDHRRRVRRLPHGTSAVPAGPSTAPELPAAPVGGGAPLAWP